MNTSPVEDSAKHALVRAFVEARIRSGELSPGDRLPTESDLMKRLDVSRSPVRQALQELERDGWIYRIRGSGSYVKRVNRRASLDIYAILYSNHRGIEKDMIHGMRRAVAQHPSENVHLVLKNPGKDTGDLIDVINELPQPEAGGGLVVIPVLSTTRALNRLLGASMRKVATEKHVVVQLDRCVPEFDGNYVTSNHQSAARKMTDYLLSMGHRRIGCVYEHPENTSIRDRLLGVRMALLDSEHGADSALQLDMPVSEVARRAEDVVRWIRDNAITAVFCFESELAREVYRVLERADIHVPDDVSLASIDDHSFAGVKEGFLTAVIQRLEDLGYYAVEMILNSLEHPRSEPTKMMLEPELLIRSSVARVDPH